MKNVISTLFFLTLVLGGGAIIGLIAGPSEWYAQLSKPSFNPPNWVFAPVWTFLYVLIALAGSRTWLRDRAGAAMKLWAAQMFLNFLWSPVFFGAHRIGEAFAVILLLLAAIGAYILCVRRKDKFAALLFAPYLAWVSFAAVLNGVLFWLN